MGFIYETAVKYKDELVEIKTSYLNSTSGWVIGYDDSLGIMIEPFDLKEGWLIEKSPHGGSRWGTSIRLKHKDQRGYWVQPEQIVGLAQRLGAEEFAEKYADQQVQIKFSSVDFPTWVDRETPYFARVIGYEFNGGGNMRVMLELPEQHGARRGWDMTREKARGLVVSPEPSHGWYVHPNELIPPTTTTKSAGGKRIIPDWPHKCPACKGPALMMGITMIDCKAACTPQYTYRSGR